ncbi:peptidase S74, partial [Escherichia coli]
PLTDLGGKTSIFSHPVYLFLREFSLQDFRGGSQNNQTYRHRRKTLPSE